MSKYSIGIDLGTTNCALAFCERSKSHVQQFHIPQQECGALPMLPSCLYFDEEEAQIIGQPAKERGSKIPTRFVHSAKSWLSNCAASRKERILPEAEGKISPVEATACYLNYLREAWNQAKAKNAVDAELEEQEIILTIPASFDEIARKLTLEAAQMAGLRSVTLLEEPQAAFYNWLHDHHTSLSEDEVILVCDIGGGTTDFSLIEAKNGSFMRMAVGNHLLLGGDNMDHALAYAVQKKLNQELETHQWLSLVHQARDAKESLLTQSKKEVALWLAKAGASVVGGGVKATLSHDEAVQILLEGFFPLLPFHEAIKLQKSSGIKTMGLPYESDPCITKQLAFFLSKCEHKPTAILFNGGAVKPQVFQQRIIDSLELWFGTKIKLLPSNSLDLAVCRGATYFARARSGDGIRIQSGTPRAYYLKVRQESQELALTLLPRGTQEGTSYISDYKFSLLANQPVSFELFHSHTRLNDALGALIPIDEEQMLALPPLQTILKHGKTSGQIPIKLKITLTEIGTLELHLLSEISPHEWLLEFSMERQAKRQDETFDTHYLDQAKKTVQETFAFGTQQDLNSLMPELEKLLGRTKTHWPLSLLRGLFDPLLHQAEKRSLAPHFEMRFWNLAGFFLRPGIGYPLDEHRVSEMWKLILEDTKKVKSDPINIQKWIFYRRIAAGLSKGQQSQLFNALYPTLFKEKQDKYLYSEKLRALASFELVETSHKVKLGNALLKRIETNKAHPVDYWALGRLGARQLLHGSLANVISKKVCEDWVTRLINCPWQDPKQTPFTLVQLIRKTDSLPLNLSENIITLAKNHLDPEALTLLEQERTHEEQERLFGESLPSGLTISS